MFRQSFLSLRLLGEQDEGISGSAAVRFLDKENAVLLVQNIAGLLTAGEELDLINRKSQLSSVTARTPPILTTCLAEQS